MIMNSFYLSFLRVEKRNKPLSANRRSLCEKEFGEETTEGRALTSVQCRRTRRASFSSGALSLLLNA